MDPSQRVLAAVERGHTPEAGDRADARRLATGRQALAKIAPGDGLGETPTQEALARAALPRRRHSRRASHLVCAVLGAPYGDLEASSPELWERKHSVRVSIG